MRASEIPLSEKEGIEDNPVRFYSTNLNVKNKINDSTFDGISNMHRNESSIGSTDFNADRRKLSEEIRRKSSVAMRQEIHQAIEEQEADKNQILEEFEKEQFDIIEKEVEKTKFIRDGKIAGYSYFVLIIIFLIYTGN